MLKAHQESQHSVSHLKSSAQKGSQAVSGSGMDKQVAKTPRPLKKWGIPLLAALLVAYAGYSWFSQPSGRALAVNADRIVISTVSKGTFEDFIPLRGRVTPAKTVYLDAVEGGRVERILVEDGASLEAGQQIVELSNASLQLSVLGNEARVAEQLNNMRTIELSLEQNRLQHKRNLIDIRHQIKLLMHHLRLLQPKQHCLRFASCAKHPVPR